MIKYIICFNQRSGSSWLASLLESVGLGPCREFHKDDDFGYFEDCLGVKVTQGAMKVLLNYVDLDNCKLIRLNRRDKMRQAISFWRAEMTQRWSCFVKNNNPEPEFDRTAITKRLSWLELYDKNWINLLGHRDYLEIWYEDMLEDCSGVVDRIADFIGRSPTGKPTTEFVIQRDAKTEEYLQMMALKP